MHEMLSPPISSEDCPYDAARPPKGRFAAPRGPFRMKEQVRRMRGGSQAHLMRCLTDSYYIVKFQGNPQGTKVLANDLLGTQLAAYLGLPTTPTAICCVSEELIKLTGDLCFQMPRTNVPCPAGLHFGSRFPLDPHRVTVFDFLPDNLVVTEKNARDFAGMLVFDKWTCNTDGRQTIFYRTEIGAPYQTVMIDQGFCFNAAEWSFPDAPRRGLYARPEVYKHVRGLDDFEPWLGRLESRIDAAVLTEIAKTIPPEWYESNWDGLQRLLERLERRRGKVRDLLWDTWRATRYVFPNWNCSVAVASAVSA
jgi:hypothetical protein